MSDEHSKLRILWLKTGPLHPLDTGGKIRTFNMLREICRSHDLTYLALCAPETDPAVLRGATEYSQRQIWVPWTETPKRTVRFFLELGGNFFGSKLPYVIAKYASREMARRIREMDASGGADLIVCDFLTPAVNLFADGFHPQTPALLFQHNVEALIWKRLFEQASHPLKRAYFRGQWRRLAAFEKETGGRFDGVAGVSGEDCRLMRSDYGLDNVLGAVPLGVDTAFFDAVPRKPKPYSIAFLGSMDWMPNMDAVQYFVSDVFPAIRREMSGAVFTVIGRNPPPAIRELAEKDPAIRVTGTVPDVRPFLSEAAAVVVPLRVGGGTRIKIYEALAANVPVVSTGIGMEGLPLSHGEHLLVADNASAFAESTLELLRHPEKAGQMAARGRRLVEERFGWKAATDLFLGYCREAMEIHRRRTSC